MNAFLLVALGSTVIAFLIPIIMWRFSDRTPNSELDPKDFVRARALPFQGDGHIPQDRDRSVEQDTYGFRAVVLLLFRAWPFVRPQLLGQWHTVGNGTNDAVADNVTGEGYSLLYAPFLVTAIAIAGPLLGWIDSTLIYPNGLIYITVAGAVIGIWLLASRIFTGRTEALIAIVLALCAFFSMLLCILVLDGALPVVYGTLITVTCGMAWMVQFRVHSGRIQTRIRFNSHLTYLYILAGIQGFVSLPLGLIIADLLGNSLLLNNCVQPEVANSWFFAAPDTSCEVTDTLSGEQQHDLKWQWVKLNLLIWAINLPIGMVVPYYTVWIMQRINQDLRLALVERWHQLSLNYHSGHRTGDSIYRIYADSAQVTTVIGRLVGLILICWYWVYALFLLSFLSPVMGTIAFSLLIPAILLSRWGMPRMRTRSLVYRAATSDVTSRIQEAFASIKLIKAHNAEEKTQTEMESDSVIAMNAAFQVRRLIALVTILMFTIASAFLLGGEFFIAISTNLGNEVFAKELIAAMAFSFTIWNLTAFNFARGKFFETVGNVRAFMRNWLSAQDMAMGLSRVFDILDIEPDIEDDPDAVAFTSINREIRFQDVSFRYEEDRPVLEDVSFVAKPGSVTAIIGPTGSGKSTVMSLLLRLYDPSSGTISIDDRPLNRYQIASLRANVAIALQENVLFAMSVRDNIRYVAPQADDAQINRAVQIACMDDYVNGLPNGLDTVLGDRGGKLSTGQRQRLSIARAVVRDAPILILDEPTASLDAATEQRVMANLSEWGRDRAIFLITHRISTIRRADNILYLDEGRIIESGNHQELMQREGGRYRAFVEAETNLSRIGAA